MISLALSLLELHGHTVLPPQSCCVQCINYQAHSTPLYWVPFVLVPSGTYNQPKWNRDAEAEYRQAHIDGAVRFNIEKICDVTNPIPLMLPSVEQFEKDVGEVSTMSMRTIYKLSTFTCMPPTQ